MVAYLDLKAFSGVCIKYSYFQQIPKFEKKSVKGR